MKDNNQKKNVSLLIVDDSEIMRTKINNAFEEGVFAIHTASNGLEAIELARAVKPDLVTMDLTMPKMDGIECISKLVLINPKIRILVISALADNVVCIESLSRGASGFLNKPFTDDDLKKSLNILMEE